jgi:catechol 2,3-dioxygenase-like lactoylglutathione lyase family enzyme
MFTYKAMDHIVLNVQDMEPILDFYMNVLGLPGERIEAFQNGEVPFPSVRVSADTVIDLFPIEQHTVTASGDQRAILNHFCLVIDETAMPEVIEHLQQHGVDIVEGPAMRWGAHGHATSIYFFDPENRKIEIRSYDHA